MSNGTMTAECIFRTAVWMSALIAVLLIPAESFAQKKNLNEIRRAAELSYLAESDRPVERHRDDYAIPAGAVVDADVVVVDGDLIVDGEIKGTAIVVDGNIRIGKRGVIWGDAVAVSGDIFRKRGSIITGDEIETGWRNLMGRSKGMQRWTSKEFSRKYSYSVSDDAFTLRYNRVEGLFLGHDILRQDWYTNRFFSLYGDIGYGFESEKWRYTLGIEKDFSVINRFVLGVKSYNLTDSDDFWRIGSKENTAAALIAKEDFIDWYSRRGFTAYASQEMFNTLFIQLEYRSDEYESMANRAKWSLFGGDKVFRPNPLVLEGTVNSINIQGRVDTRNDSRMTDRGWWIQFDGEYTSPDLDSDFDYDRHILDIRRYQPVSLYENINVRVMFGTSDGVLPFQRLFKLGGIGSLRGYDYNEFSGSSMFLLNLEYLFDQDRILFGPLSNLPLKLTFALFFDAGAATAAHQSDYVKSLSTKIMRHDMGFGITKHDGSWRLNCAWRTDTGNRDLRVTFRLKRPF